MISSGKHVHEMYTPLNPTLYIKTEVDLCRGTPIFLIFAPRHTLRYSLEPPHQGGSNVYTQSMFGRGGSDEYLQPMVGAKIRKISKFLS